MNEETPKPTPTPQLDLFNPPAKDLFQSAPKPEPEREGLKGMEVLVFRFDGTKRKTRIIHETQSAILFRDIDQHPNEQAWMPKWVWVENRYFSSPLNIMTISVPRRNTLVWRQIEPKQQ